MALSTKALKALADQAAETEDQTVVTADFESRLPEKGKTVGRFIEYIELGKQPGRPTKNNKNPKPADEVRIVFELLGPKNVRVEGEGKEKTTYADRISLKISKKFSGKAHFKKLFESMRYGRDGIKHMAQMIGEAFLIEVIHNTVGEGDQKKTYANIRDDNGWLVSAPMIEDPLEGTVKKLKVQEPVSPLRMFIWNTPTQECWDSLFIDGTRTKKNAKGEEEEVSKNWLQETITSALNFEGSAVQEMLAGEIDYAADDTEPEGEEVELATEDDEPAADEVADDDAEAEEVPEPAPKKPAKAAAPAKKAAPATTKPAAKPAAKAPAKVATPTKPNKLAAKPAGKPASTPAKGSDADVLAELGLAAE
jgi:hypothetical protein